MTVRKRLPSKGFIAGQSAGELFAPKGNRKSAMDRGTEIHARYEQLEWFEGAEKPEGFVELWRERPFEVLADGVWELEEPLRVNGRDLEVTIRAEHPGKAILTGAVSVKGWTRDPKDARFLAADFPFEPGEGYSAFQVYALLKHRGDFTRAAAALVEKGYGIREDPALGVDFSGFKAKLAQLDAPSSDATDAVVPESAQQGRSASGTDSAVICRTLAELFRTYPKLREPIVCGLLRKGETMNLIAPPKTGKSWLVGSLAMAVARGEDWIGFHCVKSRVLIIDNELHGETITDRFRTLCGARSLSPEQFQDNLVVESQRGKLRDVNRIMELCESYSAFRPSLVIIDAFYRALPKDVEENNNGAITQVYNQIDAIANKLGCAIVLVHHTSKGNQAFKSTTDSGAGAGAISRAADTHVVLRRHKEKNCAVFDAVVRSWPGFDRFGIRFGYPLWTRDDAIDVEDIEGVQVKKDPPAEVEDDELVRALVGQVDPENPLSKTNFINQAVRKIRLGPEQSKVQKKFVCIALETAINAGYLVCDRVEHPKRGQQASKFVMLGEKRLPEKATDDSFGEENESDDED